MSIPSVGTITLEQQPASLNVVDKMMLPPSYKVSIRQEESIPDHQVVYLSVALQEERGEVLQRLNNLGQQLHDRIKSGGFYWKGIGLLSTDPGPMPLSLPALDPVPAERVVRQDASHSVLVGDQQLTSTQLTGVKEEVAEVAEKERSIFVIIGWILLVLSVLYIVFVLYQGKFRVGSTGSRQAPTGALFIQTTDWQTPSWPVGGNL